MKKTKVSPVPKLRRCVVDNKKAIFHRWMNCRDIYLKFDSILLKKEKDQIAEEFQRTHIVPNGAKVESVEYIRGLIEFQTGEVKMVEPKDIYFLDSNDQFKQINILSI